MHNKRKEKNCHIQVSQYINFHAVQKKIAQNKEILQSFSSFPIQYYRFTSYTQILPMDYPLKHLASFSHKVATYACGLST